MMKRRAGEKSDIVKQYRRERAKRYTSNKLPELLQFIERVSHLPSLLQFSSFDQCERVSKLRRFKYRHFYLRSFVTILSFASIKRRKHVTSVAV